MTHPRHNPVGLLDRMIRAIEDALHAKSDRLPIDLMIDWDDAGPRAWQADDNAVRMVLLLQRVDTAAAVGAAAAVARKALPEMLPAQRGRARDALDAAAAYARGEGDFEAADAARNLVALELNRELSLLSLDELDEAGGAWDALGAVVAVLYSPVDAVFKTADALASRELRRFGIEGGSRAAHEARNRELEALADVVRAHAGPPTGLQILEKLERRKRHAR